VSEHTPGPWRWSQITDEIPYNLRVESADGVRIAEVELQPDEKPHSTQGPANAALIAAAPDLLAALARMVAMHEKREDDELYVGIIEGYEGEELRTSAQYLEDVVYGPARDALARARGEAVPRG